MIVTHSINVTFLSRYSTEPKNQTSASGFILQAIFSQAGHESVIFSILLYVYLLGILGNVLIVLLICCNAHLLHTPMYFFLSHLSLADVGTASSVAPVALCNLASPDKMISYGGCFSQLYSFMFFENIENFLLAVMAYDRYMAICHPLHYTALMNTKHCLLMVSGCWLLSFLKATLYTAMLSCLSFCESREIPSFFCDPYPLLGLACFDITPIKMVMFTDGTLGLMAPFILVVFSYAHIFLAVVKSPSQRSKSKAFSTCGSHLSVVGLFYGTLVWVYLLPTSEDKTLASVMYTVVTPMLNPFIYSLRNNEIKCALRRLGQIRAS